MKNMVWKRDTHLGLAVHTCGPYRIERTRWGGYRLTINGEPLRISPKGFSLFHSFMAVKSAAEDHFLKGGVHDEKRG